MRKLLFIFSGGCDDTLKAHSENRLMSMINPPTDKYDYDLIVIGGGSGGLAASKVSLPHSHLCDRKKISCRTEGFQRGHTLHKFMVKCVRKVFCI